ncbi:MAG: ankyrin repeat domain-containing protein [Bacteroidetes bacterium]|nr:ankyrin repeat domain-containing protein [Bacteroidota bacterium]
MVGILIFNKVDEWIYLIPTIDENTIKNDVLLIIKKRKQDFLEKYIQNYIEDINVSFYKEKPLLHYAALYDNLNLVIFLFENFDINVKVKDPENNKPLDLADLANLTNKEICKILFKAFNNNEIVKNYFRNLFQALNQENDDSALKILKGIHTLDEKYIYDINKMVDCKENNALIIATQKRCNKSLEFIFKNFDNLDFKIKGKEGTLFHHINNKKTLDLAKKYINSA